MKPEELMTGNWVIDNGKYAQITGVTCDGNIETTVNEKSNIEFIEPIPLTPEILKRFGFICTQKAEADEIEREYECWSFRDGLLSIVFEPDVVMLEVHNGGENGNSVRTINYYTDNDIMYLHELQNLLTICRIEKEIEL